jgi:hypothetical protein
VSYKLIFDTLICHSYTVLLLGSCKHDRPHKLYADTPIRNYCLVCAFQIDGHLAADVIIGYYDRTNFTDSSSYVDDSDSPRQLDATLTLDEAPLTSHLLQLQQQQFSRSIGDTKLLVLQPQQQQPRHLQHRLTDVQLATALLQRSLSVAISHLDGLDYSDAPCADVDRDVSSSDNDTSDSDATASGGKSANATAATATAKQQREALLRSPSQQQIQQQLQPSQRSVHSGSIRSGSQSPKMQNINNRSRRRRHRYEALSSAEASTVSSAGGTATVATQQLEGLPLDASDSGVVANAEQQALAEAAAAAARRDAAVQACAAAYNRGAMSGADFIEHLGAALVSDTATHAVCHLLGIPVAALRLCTNQQLVQQITLYALQAVVQAVSSVYNQHSLQAMLTRNCCSCTQTNAGSFTFKWCKCLTSLLAFAFVNVQHQGGGAAEARAALSEKGGTVLQLLRYTRSRDLQATLKRMPPVKQLSTTTATAAASTTTSTAVIVNDASSDAGSVQHSTTGTADRAAEHTARVQSVVVDSSTSKSKHAQSSRVEAMRVLLSRSKQRHRSSSTSTAKIAATAG